MLARIRSMFRMLFRREEFERSMRDEMTFHLDAYADDLVKAGVPVGEARRRARVEFGARGAIEEESRQARGIRVVDEIRQDVRFAARQFRRSPGVAAVAIISLAFGIGANATIFSLMDAIVFRTLAVDQPGTLFFLAHGSGRDISTSANYPLLARYESSGLFESVTSSTQRSFIVDRREGPERVDGEFVSGNYHAALGVRLQRGRGFTDEPDHPDGRAPVAVISDMYWARRFGRSDDAVGQTLSIGGRTVTIVGVTVPGFEGINPGTRADLTMPLFVRAMDDAAFFNQRDRWISLRIIGRQRHDLTEVQTRTAVSDLFRRYWEEPGNERRPGDVRLGALVPAGRGMDGLRDRYGVALQLLLAMVIVVLLIACANVSNLFLARGVARAREVAVRLSLGAGRARLVRQMLTESGLAALVGAALGLAVATTATRIVASAFAAGPNPVLLDVRLNASVLAFTVMVAMACTLLTGLAPALKSSRLDVTPVLKEGTTRARTGRWNTGRVLVAMQLALCFVVVTVATLFGRTVVSLRAFDPGFSRERVLLFNLDASNGALTRTDRAAFYATLDERLRAVPGVEALAYTQRSPLDRSEQTRPVEIPGIEIPRDRRGVSAHVITPEFFRVFDIGLVRGRGLGAADRAGAEPVAVVDELFVQAYFGSADPIGRRLFLGADREPFTVVGVVRSARFESMRDDPKRTIYTALAQSRVGSAMPTGDALRITVAVRSTAEPARFTGTVRDIVGELSRNVIVTYARTMEEQFNASMLRERLLAGLSLGYGLLALTLSMVGLYGVTSFGVARRARDIGVRMALGASRRRVLREILAETLATSAVGIVFGLAGAAAVSSLVSGFLFGVGPNDPATFVTVTLVLTATALIAGLVPGRRAASIDPVRTLKSD
jgi:predicted permease